MVRKLYDSSGNYRGFLDDVNIYNTSGRFVGFIDPGGNVYTSNGDFVGSIVDDCVVEEPLKAKQPKGARLASAREPTTAAPRKSILLNSKYRDGFDKLENE
jgi:hypothetical protein